MIPIDPTHSNQNELNPLILDQENQAAKLRLEVESMLINLDKGIQSSVNLVDLSQVLSGVPGKNAIDKQKRHKHEPSPGRSSNEIPLTLQQPDPIIDIKPKWRTKNRLQNCHSPKPK
ncbi:MAG: hypothetical protein NT121_03170 [Chloroflexi bacterium]|nr:hypothetical protein [Chloroflexota bacterium]